MNKSILVRFGIATLLWTVLLASAQYALPALGLWIYGTPDSALLFFLYGYVFIIAFPVLGAVVTTVLAFAFGNKEIAGERFAVYAGDMLGVGVFFLHTYGISAGAILYLLGGAVGLALANYLYLSSEVQ